MVWLNFPVLDADIPTSQSRRSAGGLDDVASHQQPHHTCSSIRDEAWKLELEGLKLVRCSITGVRIKDGVQLDSVLEELGSSLILPTTID